MMNLPRPKRKIDDFTKLMIAMFLTPAPFEITIGIVKRDSYDFRRLAIILGTLILLALIMAAVRTRIRWYPQTIVGYYVGLIGIAMTAFGVSAVIFGDQVRALTRWSSGVEVLVTALTPSLGILLTVSGIYLVYDRHKRAKDELDTPLPARISMAKMTPLDRHTSAIWQSEDNGRQKGRESLIRICQGYLSVADLHYVAKFDKDGDCDFYVDLFDDDALVLLATGESSDRRSNYVRHGRHFRHLTGKLDRRLDDLDTGILVRVVMDVEKGAIFFYNLGGRGFLIGVTLDQQRVDPSDWKMSNLANAILRAYGEQEDDDFYRLCPVCGGTNRDHKHAPPDSAGNVVPIPRPKEVG